MAGLTRANRRALRSTTASAEVITHAEIFNDPEGVVDRLVQAGLYGLTDVETKLVDRNVVIYWLALDPLPPMAHEGYPTEKVSICVWRNGGVKAIPHHARARSWAHRQADVISDHRFTRAEVAAAPGEWGALCLWYPDDPPTLRWDWPDGLAHYITIVHRHLQAEEYRRRHGRWPVEDAPHGRGDHPVRTEAMTAAAHRWSTSC